MRLILIFLYSVCTLSVYAQKEKVLLNCEQATTLFTKEITPLLQKNDFQKFDEIIHAYQENCGLSELSLRIQILRNLIEKKNTKALLSQYQENKFEQHLAQRFKEASHSDYQKIYEKNPEKFDYVPLRHPLDQLVQIKSDALLQSEDFPLLEEEESILFLFAGDIELYSQLQKERAKELRQEKQEEIHASLNKYSGIVYLGMIGPLGAINPIFKLNPSFGIQVMSPVQHRFFYELGVKLQINSGSRNFEYQLDESLEDINSDLSFYIGADVGFVAWQRKKIMLIPKIGLGFKSVSTGLSENTYVESSWYDKYEDASGMVYHNVNTMDLSFSIAGLQHLHKRKYIGLQASYHLIPYNWDKNLKTDIFSHYGSLDLIVRF